MRVFIVRSNRRSHSDPIFPRNLNSKKINMATGTPETFPNLDHLNLNKEFVDRTPLTQRRYTPYTKSNLRTQVLTKTPLPHFHKKQSSKTQEAKRSSGRRRLQELTNDTTEDFSSRIVNRTWRVYRVSPLYCFKTDAKTLKLYEKRLNSILAVETCGTGEARSSVKMKASFTKLEADGDYGVEIKIRANEGKESAGKDELVAILCCGRNVNENTNTLNGDLTSLPVCLIKSTVLLKDTFLQWLENEFGCRACPLLFSPTDLAWLVSLCAGIGEPTTSVEFTYAVPQVMSDLDTIYFKMDAKDARRIWDVIHDPKQPYFTSDEANRILNSFETHFYHHFKIHLNQMQLVTVGTSVAYIGQEGRVKILQEPYVHYILQQLSQLANF